MSNYCPNDIFVKNILLLPPPPPSYFCQCVIFMMQLLFDELHVFLSRLLVVYSVLLLFTIKVLLLLCAVAGNLACTKVVKPSAATCVFVCLNHELFFLSLGFCVVWVSLANKHKLCKAMLKFFWVQTRQRKLRCSPTPHIFVVQSFCSPLYRRKPGRIRSLSIRILLKTFALFFNRAHWSHAWVPHSGSTFSFLVSFILCAMFATPIKSVQVVLGLALIVPPPHLVPFF